MSSSPESASTRLQSNADRMEGSGQRADLVYQTVTIAAMLLLLGSLWLF
jgi:hypothetical protein